MKPTISLVKPLRRFVVVSHQRMVWLHRATSVLLVTGIVMFATSMASYAFGFLSLSLLCFISGILLPERLSVTPTALTHQYLLLSKASVFKWSDVQSMRVVNLQHQGLFSLQTRLMATLHWQLVCIQISGQPTKFFWCKHVSQLISSLEFSLFEAQA